MTCIYPRLLRGGPYQVDADQPRLVQVYSVAAAPCFGPSRLTKTHAQRSLNDREIKKKLSLSASGFLTGPGPSDPATATWTK